MVKKVEDFFRKYYKDIILILIIVCSLFLTFFYFDYSLLRFKEGLRDLIRTIIFYFCSWFDINYNVTVTEFSDVPFKMPFGLPGTWDEFRLLFSDYWDVFFDPITFSDYCYFIVDILYYFSQILFNFLMIFTPVFIVKLFKKPIANNDYDVKSKFLTMYLLFELRVIFPVIDWFKDFIRYIIKKNIYLKFFVVIWLWNFNIFTILLEFFAYYYYVFVSSDFINLYVQVLKLLMDLSIMIDFLPGFVWFIIGLFIFNYIRKRIGFNELEHQERMNRGYINERPIISFYFASMGAGKTKTATDNGISEEIILRDKALELMFECDLKFPRFPWINFENELKEAIDKHEVYHLVSAKKFVDNLKTRFLTNKCVDNIFGYDYKNYPIKYDNGTNFESIWSVLKDYAQLYLIYIIESSLIISNYSIRVDNVLETEGNFPLWNDDLFGRTAEHVEFQSRFSHICIFDMLRLGKKVTNSDYADSFEFGVVIITEIGKERKNQLELQVVKAIDALANQKNDLFNYTLKFIRHRATIMGYCFVKIFVDDQRPESWGADARDLCEIVNIAEVSEERLTMPFFEIEEIVHHLLLGKHKDKYYEDRYWHGDKTLFMYLYHLIVAKFHNYYRHVYNTFGYKKEKLLVESGRMDDNKISKKNYYIMNKKINFRYSTNCYSPFFDVKSERSLYGLDDIPAYSDIVASYEDLKLQGSYMFGEMTQVWSLDEKK